MTSVPATNDLETLQQWIGRTETLHEPISLAQCRRLHDTLGLDGELHDGDAIPPLWHFVFHLTSAPIGRLGRDGHPERGGFLPPVALPRRMWAGGRFTFHGDLRIGDAVTKTSTVESVEMKSGRTGQLCFVTVRHELSVDGDVRVIEEQDLVYREDPAPGAPKPEPKPAPTEADWSRTIEPSEVLLFRYSALTFNGHRIHYDREYAREVEGYEGLVFHGPLTATLLAGLAADQLGPLGTFSFRGLSPLFDDAPFEIGGIRGDEDTRLWAATPSGGLAMQATATARA
jgi:3-methylfumaryl-CoA hydratase